MDERCCETPLLDLLRRVPGDACGEYEHEPGMHYSFIPYGSLCHRAADRIEELEKFIIRLGYNADMTPQESREPGQLMWRARFVDEE
jgi:hypothetical protein